MSRPPAVPPSRPSRALLPAAALSVLLLAACSLLPGQGEEEPEPAGPCTVRIQNDAAWGLRVFLRAPDGRPPIVFEREIRYLERDAHRSMEVPCGYGSALVIGAVRRVSGLSGLQRTRFRSGVCLVPGDTAVAVLDEYGEWNERWWEDCPEPGGGG